MIYNKISGEVCVARVIDRYNIKTNDWITRSNEWIASCINKLRIITSFQSDFCDITVTNYRFKLPCDLTVLDAITYNGYRITLSNNVDNINHDVVSNPSGSYISRPLNNTIPVDDGIQFTETIENYTVLPIHSIIKYTPNNNGWVDISNLETGDIVLYYKHLPIEYSKEYKVYFPLVPDVEDVLELIDLYILIRILARGYKHEVYALQSGQHYLNPKLLFDKQMPIAKSAAKSFSGDQRRNITTLLTTFLQNTNSNTNYTIYNRHGI